MGSFSWDRLFEGHAEKGWAADSNSPYKVFNEAVDGEESAVAEIEVVEWRRRNPPQVRGRGHHDTHARHGAQP